MMSSASEYNVTHFRTTFPAKDVAHVELNRPEKMNALTPDMFHNLCTVFDRLSEDENVRCILLSGAGDRAFCSGLDVQAASSAGPVSHPDAKADVARRAWKIRRLIYDLQNCVSAIERCEKPVIALCHGVAYGAAIDIVTAADIRYCTKSTKFSIKEVDIGLAADVGTLSRLPKIGVSYSWAKEATYTARIFGGEEAGRVGFVSRVFEDKQALLIEGLELASLIATKSPVAVLSSKAIMDYSRDRSVEDGLKFTASWNAAMVQADDVNKATMGALRKTKTTFQKL